MSRAKLRMRMLWWLAATFLFGLICIPLARAQSPLPVSEQDALRLLAPIVRGGEIYPGWTLGEIVTHQEFVRYTVAPKALAAKPSAASTGCRIVFEIQARRPDSPGVRPLEKYSLFIWQTTCDPLPDDLVDAFSEAIARNEEEVSLAFRHASSTGQTPDKPLTPPQLFIVALFAGLALLVSLLVRKRETLFPPSRQPGDPPRPALLLAALVLLAGVLRLFDSPWTVANVNGHACEYIQLAMDGVWQQPMPYNNGYYWFFNLLFQVGLPRLGETIMAANAVLGALSVWGLYGLVVVLLRDRWAALAVAGLWAVLPSHVRFSSTEDIPALVALMQILVALAAVTAARRPGWVSFGALGGLIAFAVQVRPEMWLLPLVAAGFFVAEAGGTGLRKAVVRPSLWIVIVLLALLSAESVVDMTAFMSGTSSASRSIAPLSLRVWEHLLLRPLGSAEGIGNLTLNPRFSSPALGVLAAAGLVLLVRDRWRVAATLVASYLAFAVLAVGFQMGVLPTMRLQVGYQWIVICCAGVGLAWLIRRARGRHPALGWATFMGLLVMSYVPYRPFVQHAFSTQLEYAFAKEAFRAIPDDCTLVVLDQQVEMVATAVPHWIPLHQGRTVSVEEASAFLHRGGPAAGECAVWYRGLTCFTFRRAEPPGGVERSLCARMDALGVAEVVAARAIEARQPGSLQYRIDPIPLELRLLSGLPPR